MDKMTEIFEKASQFASQYIEPVADKLDKEKAFPEEVFDKRQMCIRDRNWADKVGILSTTLKSSGLFRLNQLLLA